MDNFKNIYKEKIELMSFDELQKELNEVNSQLMKGRAMISKGLNPYPDKKKVTGFNMKKLKYMKVIVMNKLNQSVTVR